MYSCKCAYIVTCNFLNILKVEFELKEKKIKIKINNKETRIHRSK